MNIILTLIIAAVLLSAATAGLSAAPWVPTKPKQRRHLIQALDLKDGETCYDLGCGDGTVLFALARKNPNICAIGYDISLLPLAIGKLRKLLGGKKYRNVSIRFGNLFTRDISDANHVFVFLLNKSYPRLRKKFAAELADDANVIVEAWPIKDVEHASEIREDGLLPVFIYRGSSFR